MNKYLHINRVEFLITENCTSECRHCSNVSSDKTNSYITAEKGISILKEVQKEYRLESVMTFGGEPLLYPDSVTAILNYARETGVPTRQIITNAFWSRNKSRIDEICLALEKAEVNNILVSVDCFHQEHLDPEIINYTLSKLAETELEGIRLHPCWYESESGNNEYDKMTREILDGYSVHNFDISSGNILFPDGRAVENFPERFKSLESVSDICCGKIPHTERPDNIDAVCLNPEGFVTSQCFGRKMEIKDFLENYDPHSDPVMKVFLEKGIEECIRASGISTEDFDISKYYSVCEACLAIRRQLA